MSKYQSELEEYLEVGIDIAKRRIHFGIIGAEEGESVSWHTVERIIRGLHRMYDAGSGPIELHMSCFGGCVYSMLRLVDEIEASPCQVKFVGGGQIMSAATWIMAVCDYRIVHKNARIMIHDGSNGFEDRHIDLIITAEEDKNVQEKLYELYANNSRMPKEFWADICQRDVYLTPEEALNLGLVDEVVQPKKRGNVRKAREKVLNKHPSTATLTRLTNSIYKRIHRKTPTKLVVEIKKEEVDFSLSEKQDENIKNQSEQSSTSEDQSNPNR